MNLTCLAQRTSCGIAAVFALVAAAPVAAAGHWSIDIDPAAAHAVSSGPAPIHGMPGPAYSGTAIPRPAPAVLHRAASPSHFPAAALRSGGDVYRNDHYHYHLHGHDREGWQLTDRGASADSPGCRPAGCPATGAPLSGGGS